MHLGVLDANIGEELPGPGQERDGSEQHMSQCLDRHARNHAANGIVDTHIDVQRHRVVAHRVDGDAHGEKGHGVQAESRNSLFHNPLQRHLRSRI